MLIYLVLEGGRQPRAKLAALLWPESDMSRGRANLCLALNNLRDSLPADEAGNTLHLNAERNAPDFNVDAPRS